MIGRGCSVKKIIFTGKINGKTEEKKGKSKEEALGKEYTRLLKS